MNSFLEMTIQCFIIKIISCLFWFDYCCSSSAQPPISYRIPHHSIPLYLLLCTKASPRKRKCRNEARLFFTVIRSIPKSITTLDRKERYMKVAIARFWEIPFRFLLMFLLDLWSFFDDLYWVDPILVLGFVRLWIQLASLVVPL